MVLNILRLISKQVCKNCVTKNELLIAKVDSLIKESLSLSSLQFVWETNISGGGVNIFINIYEVRKKIHNFG